MQNAAHPARAFAAILINILARHTDSRSPIKRVGVISSTARDHDAPELGTFPPYSANSLETFPLIFSRDFEKAELFMYIFAVSIRQIYLKSNNKIIHTL